MRDVLVLLRRGRPGMAARLLEDLPARIDAALQQAFEAGQAEAGKGKRGGRRRAV